MKIQSPIIALTLLIGGLLTGCTSIQINTHKTTATNTEMEQRRSLAMTLKRYAKNPKELTPKLNSLLNANAENLYLILDVIWPDSASLACPSLDTFTPLSEKLASDDYATARASALKLYALGPGARDHIQTQLEATTDPVVSIFLTGVLSCWENSVLNEREEFQIQRVLSEYIEGITNTATILVLQKRIIDVCGQEDFNMYPSPILTSILRASVRTRDDGVVNQLSPLLKHDNISMATTVVRGIGSGGDNRYFPELLLIALRSDQEPVVDEAIKWTPNCWDRSKSRDVHRCLKSIFDGDNKGLKFHACFPLMHSYGDRKAVAYLLSQIRNENKPQSLRAIAWIGDACNSGKPVYPELIETLVPLLSSENLPMRRAAANALGTYSGEQVIKNLIPLLADSDKTIASEVRYELVNQRDKEMLQRLLSEAADNTNQKAVAIKAQEIIQELNRK